MEYFIKASVVLGIFYICYILFLQRETFFKANRWFLLIGLITASLLPLIVIPIYVKYTPININSDLFANNPIDNSPNNNSITLLGILSWVYISGFMFFLAKLLIEFTSLFSLINNNKHRKESAFTYIETDNNIPPFSFFNWIVFNPNQFQEQELTHIINHEKVHAKQYHSIDVLLAQFSCVVFWFNPFCWLYKKELQQNLEFIADENAQNISTCEQSYQRLLLKTSIPNHPLVVTNNFYNSLIKKRIVMLHKSKSNKLQAWKFSIILPLLALFLMSFNTKEVYVETANTLKSLEKSKQTEKHSKIEKALITKDFTNAFLDNVKYQLFKEGLTISFKGIKRNASNEIIAIKIDVKSKTSRASYQVNGEDAISPITIIFNKDGSSISIDNLSQNKLTIVSENGKVQKTSSDGTNKNIFVFKNDASSEEKVDYLVMDNEDKVVFTSENLNLETVEEGDKTIDILTLSDDGKLIKITDNGTLKSKSNKKVEIVELKKNNKSASSEVQETPLYILDGKEITKEELEKVNPDTIDNVNVLKGETAIKKYGKKASGGAIEINTKE